MGNKTSDSDENATPPPATKAGSGELEAGEAKAGEAKAGEAKAGEAKAGDSEHSDERNSSPPSDLPPSESAPQGIRASEQGTPEQPHSAQPHPELGLPEAVGAHPHGEALADIARTVFLQRYRERAEGGSMLIGKHFVLSLAERRGLRYEDAELGGWNVFALLAGTQVDASTDKEELTVHQATLARAKSVLESVAAKGFVQFVAAADGETRERRLTQFFACADWFALTQSVDLYGSALPYLDDPTLESSIADDFWAFAEKGIRTGTYASVSSIASAISRAVALRGSDAVEGGIAKELLARSISAPALRAAVRVLASAPRDYDSHTLQIDGRLSRARLRPLGRWGLWLSGLAAISGLFRTFFAAAGFRHIAELTITGELLEIKTESTFWGRLLRTRDLNYRLRQLESVKREARFPMLPSFAGALALGVGILLGGVWLFEGIVGGDTWLLLSGAGVMLLGLGFDLLQYVLLPAARAECSLYFTLASGESFSLRGVDEHQADYFMNALTAYLPSSTATDSAPAAQGTPLASPAKPGSPGQQNRSVAPAS